MLGGVGICADQHSTLSSSLHARLVNFQVEKSVARVRDSLEQYVNNRNEILQEMLTEIDNKLTDSRAIVDQLQRQRDSALVALMDLSENVLQPEHLGNTIVSAAAFLLTSMCFQ